MRDCLCFWLLYASAISFFKSIRKLVKQEQIEKKKGCKNPSLHLNHFHLHRVCVCVSTVNKDIYFFVSFSHRSAPMTNFKNPDSDCIESFECILSISPDGFKNRFGLSQKNENSHWGNKINGFGYFQSRAPLRMANG